MFVPKILSFPSNATNYDLKNRKSKNDIAQPYGMCVDDTLNNVFRILLCVRPLIMTMRFLVVVIPIADRKILGTFTA